MPFPHRLDGYNHRTQFPSDYVQAANVDASTGAFLEAPSGSLGFSHLVIANGDTVTAFRQVNIFLDDTTTQVGRVLLKPGTSQVVPLFGPAPSGLYIVDGNANDTAGVYATAFVVE